MSALAVPLGLADALHCRCTRPLASLRLRHADQSKAKNAAEVKRYDVLHIDLAALVERIPNLVSKEFVSNENGGAKSANVTETTCRKLNASSVCHLH